MAMNMKYCDKGEHVYDSSKHSSCPYCRKTHIVPLPIEDNKPSGDNKIDNMDNIDVLPHTPEPHLQNVTTPAPGIAASGEKSAGSKTRVVIDTSNKTDESAEVMPVVGWLVIINGKGRGNDLRITPQMNSIGRESGEIILNFGDESISREKHAYLAYSPGKNTFWFGHGDGKNLSEINDEPVIGKQELKSFDRILIGQTELLFIPLCGESFSWNRSEV